VTTTETALPAVPWGVEHVKLPELTKLTLVQLLPPIVTVAPDTKLLPAIVTVEPPIALPVGGVTEETVGAGEK
jgi:hypothetical protein